MTRDYINKQVDKEISAPLRQKLEVHEVLDGLQNAYYDLEADTANLPAELYDWLIKKWIKALDLIISPIYREGVEQFKAEL